MEIVRKEGFYMSERTARKVAERVAVVAGLNPRAKAIFKSCLTNGLPDYDTAKLWWGTLYEPSPMSGKVLSDRNPYFALSGAEIETLTRLIAWYAIEDNEMASQKCFVLVDLNTGLSLVIASRRNRMEDPSQPLAATKAS
jgi:hypothetical protein